MPLSHPIFLVLDVHKSHSSLKLLAIARQKEIINFCLPPHQPMGIGVFSSLKLTFADAVRERLKKTEWKTFI